MRPDVYCSCGHVIEQHSGGRKCRALSANGWPCECPQLDLDEPEGEEA